MLILVTCLFLFLTALVLSVLRAAQPEARYAWLVAVSGSVLALISVFIWLTQMPAELVFPAWQPQTLFQMEIFFRGDNLTWGLSASIITLTVSILLTAVTRPVFTNSLSWAGTLALCGMGVLAVTANNPLTLLLIWALFDLVELAAQLRSVNGEKNNERVVIAFATRTLGIFLLLWAYIESFAAGSILDFQSIPPSAGIYLIFAAGLRLGVLPLHLPYSADSSIRRGFGTALRLIGAASTLSVLSRVQIVSSWATPFVMLLIAGAALYGGWMWLRTPDELNGRPYWIIGIASLSILSAVNGNPAGAAAWACALVLVGGVLFLSSVKFVWLNRFMLAGVWSLSSLPFSLTASGWQGSLNFLLLFGVAAQALLAAGFIRHTLRAGSGESLVDQPAWANTVYPAGIILPVVMQILLGLIGGMGSLQVGNILFALIASLLTFGLVWGSRRFRILNPVRAHWLTSSGTGVNRIYQGLWSLYHGLARLGQTITNALEGEGGIMWTLLFLIIFISIITQGIP